MFFSTSAYGKGFDFSNTSIELFVNIQNLPLIISEMFLKEVHLHAIFLSCLDQGQSHHSKIEPFPTPCRSPRITKESSHIQLTNQINFLPRAFWSIEHELVHDFHSKHFSCRQPFNSKYISVTWIWTIKYVQYLIIAWIIPCHLESSYQT